MATYAEKLKSPLWQKKRLQIFTRDKWKCKLCGDSETTLHVHHKEYINGFDPWNYDNKLLVTLCEHCHASIEHLMKRKPEIKFDEIKVLKLNSPGYHRHMFIATPKGCFMEIFLEDNSCIDLTHYGVKSCLKLIEIFKSSLK